MSKRPAAAALLHPGFARGGRFWQCTNWAILVVNAYSYLSKRNLSKKKKEVFLRRQIRIVSYYVKKPVKNENIKTGVSRKIFVLAFWFTFSGAPVAFKTWCGHPYRVGIICPPGWDRVKVAAKTWCGHVPTSTCPQARLCKFWAIYLISAIFGYVCPKNCSNEVNRSKIALAKYENCSNEIDSHKNA